METDGSMDYGRKTLLYCVELAYRLTFNIGFLSRC